MIVLRERVVNGGLVGGGNGVMVLGNKNYVCR